MSNQPRSIPAAYRLALLILAATALLLICGCKREDGKVTTIQFLLCTTDSEEPTLRALIAKFEKRHPRIKVDVQLVGWGMMFDKLMIVSAGQGKADVARISSEWFHPLAARGLLAPLDDYVKRDHFDIDDFYPQSIDGWGRYKGVLYELPTDIDIYALYYNKDMFDKCHVPYPDWSWDWNRFVEVSKKLTKDLNGDGKLDQWGCAPDYWWQSYVFSNGGSVVSKDLRKCMLDQPAAYNGLQFMGDLVSKYQVAPNANDLSNFDFNKLFTSGKIGMIISGPWAPELLFSKEVKFAYDVAPIPKGPAARATFIGGAAYGVLRGSRHKDEAWELVKFMTGKEYQRSSAILSGLVPSRRSVAESVAYLEREKPPRSRHVVLQMIKYGRARPGVACMQEMEQVVLSELDLVRSGRKSAKEACKKITPVIDELLRHQ